MSNLGEGHINFKGQIGYSLSAEIRGDNNIIISLPRRSVRKSKDDLTFDNS